MDTNNQSPGPGGGHLQAPSNIIADLNLNPVQGSNQTPQISGQKPQKVRKLGLGEYPSYIKDRALRKSKVNAQGLTGGSGQQQDGQQIQGAQGAENTQSSQDTQNDKDTLTKSQQPQASQGSGIPKDPLSSSMPSTPSTRSSSRDNQEASFKPPAQDPTTPNGPRTGTPAQGLWRYSITGRSSLKSAPSSTPKKVAFADPRDYQNTPSKSKQESSYKPQTQGSTSSSSDGHRTATYSQVLQRSATTTSSGFKSTPPSTSKQESSYKPQAQGSTSSISSDGHRTATYSQVLQRSVTTTSSAFKSAPLPTSKQESSYKPQAQTDGHRTATHAQGLQRSSTTTSSSLKSNQESSYKPQSQGSTSSDGLHTVTLARGLQRSVTTTSSSFKPAPLTASKQDSHKSQARAPTSSKEQRPLVLPERPKKPRSSSLNLTPLGNNVPKVPKLTTPVIGQPSLKLPQPAQPVQQASKAKQCLPDMEGLKRLSSGISPLVESGSSGSSGHSNNLGPSHRTGKGQGLPSGPSLPGPSQTITISKSLQPLGLPSPLFLIPPSSPVESEAGFSFPSLRQGSKVETKNHDNILSDGDGDSEKENIDPLNSTGKRSRCQGSVLDEPLQEIDKASSGDDLSNVFRSPKSKKAKKDHLKDVEDSDDVSMTGMDDDDDDMDDSFGSQVSLCYSPTSLKALKKKKAEKAKNIKSGRIEKAENAKNDKALKSVKSGRIEKSSKSSPKSKRQKSLGAVGDIDRRKIDAWKSNRNILAQQQSRNQQHPQSPLVLARADVNKRGPVQGTVKTPEKRARYVGKESDTGSAINNKESRDQGTASSTKVTSNNHGSGSAQDTIKKPLKKNLKVPEGVSIGVDTINSAAEVSGTNQPARKITLRASKESSNGSSTNNREYDVQGTRSNTKSGNNNGGSVVTSQGADQISASIDVETDTESETQASVTNGTSNLDSVAAEIQSLQLETARSQLARSEVLRRAAEATERGALTLEQNAKDKSALTHIKLEIAREERRRLYVNYLAEEAIGVKRSRSR